MEFKLIEGWNSLEFAYRSNRGAWRSFKGGTISKREGSWFSSENFDLAEPGHSARYPISPNRVTQYYNGILGAADSSNSQQGKPATCPERKECYCQYNDVSTPCLKNGKVRILYFDSEGEGEDSKDDHKQLIEALEGGYKPHWITVEDHPGRGRIYVHLVRASSNPRGDIPVDTTQSKTFKLVFKRYAPNQVREHLKADGCDDDQSPRQRRCYHCNSESNECDSPFNYSVARFTNGAISSAAA